MTRDTFSYEALGHQLRRLREDAGFTQTKLAQKLGVTQSYISKLEINDSDPPFDVVFAWSSACGRPLTLVWGEPAPQPRAPVRFDRHTRRYEVTP